MLLSKITPAIAAGVWWIGLLKLCFEVSFLELLLQLTDLLFHLVGFLDEVIFLCFCMIALTFSVTLCFFRLVKASGESVIVLFSLEYAVFLKLTENGENLFCDGSGFLYAELERDVHVLDLGETGCFKTSA